MTNKQEDSVYALKFAIMQKQIYELKLRVEQKVKGINSLMQSRKKWKNRYYKIRKQLRAKNKELEMLKDIKEIAESKVGELSLLRISKNKSVIK